MNKDNACQCGVIDNRSDSQPSFAEFWQPGRIVSLWEMKYYNGDILWDWACRLHNEIAFLRNYQSPVGMVVIAHHEANLRKIRDEFEMLKVTGPRQMCDHILLEYFSPVKPLSHEEAREYALRLANLSERIRDHFENEKFLVLEPDEVDHYNGTKFSEEIRSAFIDGRPDMDEAGMCFAYGRYTACVFHLMRLVERHGVREVEKQFSFPVHNSWRGFLDRLTKSRTDWDENIKKTGDQFSPQAQKLRRERRLFDDLAVWVKVIEHAWRDPTMHVQSYYDKDQAERILSGVLGFLDDLIKYRSE